MQKYLFYILILTTSVNSIITPVYCQSTTNQNTADYPTLKKTDKLLFYIQRSHNRNTIAYDLNYKTNGELDLKNPVHPYWIRFEEGGNIKELSYIQERFAYGVKCKLIDEKKLLFNVFLVSYDKLYIQLIKSPKDNKIRAYLAINNKFLELQKIFIKTDGGTFWVPNVLYIEVYGKDISTGKLLIEKIIP